MTKQEILKALKAPMFKGLDVFDNKLKNQIEANYFNRTSDWKATKAALAKMGFSCGPNCALWQGK